MSKGVCSRSIPEPKNKEESNAETLRAQRFGGKEGGPSAPHWVNKPFEAPLEARGKQGKPPHSVGEDGSLSSKDRVAGRLMPVKDNLLVIRMGVAN